MFVFGSTLFGPENKKTKDDIETIAELAKRDAKIARLKSREERLLLELELTRNRMTDQIDSRDHLFDGSSELLDAQSRWPSSPGVVAVLPFLTCKDMVVPALYQYSKATAYSHFKRKIFPRNSPKR